MAHKPNPKRVPVQKHTRPKGSGKPVRKHERTAPNDRRDDNLVHRGSSKKRG